MRSAAARPASCTARRRTSGSPGASTTSTVVSAASNSSRSSTIARDSASLRRSSSARGSGPTSGSTAETDVFRRRHNPAAAKAPISHAAGRRIATMLQWRDFLPRHRAVRSRAAQAGEADSDQRKEARERGCVRNLADARSRPARPRQEEIIARTRELVQRGGGTWVRHDAWGRRRLAYEIKHKGEGVYHLLQFDAEPETLDELSRILRITDGVMRHMATRRIEGSQTSPPPEPEPTVPAPAYAEANISSQEEE